MKRKKKGLRNVNTDILGSVIMEKEEEIKEKEYKKRELEKEGERETIRDFSLEDLKRESDRRDLISVGVGLGLFVVVVGIILLLAWIF